MTYYPKTYEEVLALCREVHSLLDQALAEGWVATVRKPYTIADILSRKRAEDSVEGSLMLDDFTVIHMLQEMARADGRIYPLFSVAKHTAAAGELMRLHSRYPQERVKNINIEEQIWVMDRLAHDERLEHPNDVTPDHAKRFFKDWSCQ